MRHVAEKRAVLLGIDADAAGHADSQSPRLGRIVEREPDLESLRRRHPADVSLDVRKFPGWYPLPQADARADRNDVGLEQMTWFGLQGDECGLSGLHPQQRVFADVGDDHPI